MALVEGQLIADRYRLVSPIGEGAMGAVWRATDETLRRQVAIKFLFVAGAAEPEAMVQQFLREARIAAAVQHRNVIHTVDFGTLDNHRPFMVMELLDGESLRDRFDREPALSTEQIVHLVSLTLRGLSAVHDAGIVHRDLKPDNVFLQRDAEAVYPKILDFGISRSLDQGAERPSAIATQQGLIMGTPDYMSPEQARGQADIDRRADIYGMGVILYEGLAGRLPFETENVGELLVQILTKDPPPLAQLRPSLPPAISAIVEQAMAKDREHRFADARVMRRALLSAAEQRLPPTRRSALSSPPPAPFAAAAAGAGLLRPAPLPSVSAGGGSATWGDFEGLASSSPSGADPSAGLELDVEPSGAEPARRAPDRASRGSAAGARSSRSGKTRAKANGGLAPDVFDPMGANVEAAAVDIDYARAGVAPRQPRAVRPRPAAGQPAGRRQARPRRAYGWLIAAITLSLLALILLAAPGGWLARLGGSSVDVGRGAAGYVADMVQGETELPRSEGSAIPMRTRPRSETRRDDPKAAPPHMRDVVF